MSSLGINDHLSFMMQHGGDSNSWDPGACVYVPCASCCVLPCKSRCLAIETLLQLCELRHRREERPNVEFMSHTGQVPVLVEGDVTSCGFDEIVSHLHLKGLLPSGSLPANARLDIKAFSALIHMKLHAAETFSAWCVPENAKVSSATYGSHMVWPLSWALPYFKRRNAQDFTEASCGTCVAEEVYAEADKACNALSLRLGSSEFFGDLQPTELDALVYGHLRTILSEAGSLPDAALLACVKAYPNLVDYCTRMQKRLVVSQQYSLRAPEADDQQTSSET